MSNTGSTVMIAATRSNVVTLLDPAAVPNPVHHALSAARALLVCVLLFGVCLPGMTAAQESPKPAAPMQDRVKALVPDLEAYIQSGMKAFDVPGLAIGIVTGDRLGRSSGREALTHLRAYLGAQRIDRYQLLAGVDVPEGPAVAGLEPLRQRADPVDGTDL